MGQVELLNDDDVTWYKAKEFACLGILLLVFLFSHTQFFFLFSFLSVLLWLGTKSKFAQIFENETALVEHGHPRVSQRTRAYAFDTLSFMQAVPAVAMEQPQIAA
jgi:hypothetical protein